MKKQLRKLTGVTLAIALSTSAVHAEGFFSNLFGGSKKGTDLKSLLSHVPADTAYLMANKEAIPEKALNYHLQKSKDMMALVADSKEFKKMIADVDEGPGKFFVAWMEDYSDLISRDKISESGFSLKAKSVLYGYDMMPVMRMGITDKDKIMAMIKRAEIKSGYKVEFSKCGKFDCFETTDPKGEVAVSAVLFDDQLAVSVATTDKKEAVKKHLMGEADPKSSYSMDNWDTFLKENNYPGYGDGFINLKSAFAFARPKIAEEMKGAMDEKSLNGCLSVADQHFDNLTDIVFGTKTLEEKVIDYEILFKTSTAVSTTLQTLANDTNIPLRADNAIFDYGVNVNFTKLRDALTQYSSFLIKSGEDNKCPAIEAQEIRKGMGGMAMVMNMGLSQFKSLYASITDFQFDDKMQPKKVDAYISIGSNDPAGLIAMAGMMAPPIMAIKIPEDGSVVKLPDGLIPSRGGPTPDIFISRNKKAINIFVGNDKPELSENSVKTPEISSSSVNLKGYMSMLGNIMDAMPEGAKKAGEMPDIALLKKIGEMGGKVYSSTSADKRGLVINYNIKY